MNKIRLLFLLVLFCALIPRMIYLFSVDRRSLLLHGVEGRSYYDVYDYDALARNISDNGIYGYGSRKSSYRPPGYSFFLATLYTTFGRNMVMVRIIQILLGCVLCLMIFKVALLFFGYQQAVISGLLSAFYPFFIFFNVQLLSETLFATLTIGSVLCLALYMRSRKVKYTILAGILWGLASLTRSILLPLAIVPFVMLIFVSNKKTMNERVFNVKLPQQSFIFLTALLVTLVPWMLRNALVHKAFVPISTNGGYNLYLGNVNYYTWSGKHEPDNMKRYYKDLLDDTAIEMEVIEKTEIEADRESYKSAFSFIFSEPVMFIKIYIMKISDYWHIFLHKEHSLAKRILVFMFSLFIIGAGFTGIISSLSADDKVFHACTFLLIIFSTLIHALFISNIRMRVSMADPLLILYCGAGIAYLVNKIGYNKA